MKKLLLVLVACFAFAINAFAAVNINTASQAELETLEGIGPVKAQAIIDYRKKHGAFKDVAELEKVEGVGPVTMQKLRGQVSTAGVTSVPKSAIKAEGNAAERVGTAKAKEVKTKSETVKVEKTRTVGSESAAESGKIADTKTVREPKAAADKSHEVGTEKAAASGKTADSKIVNESDVSKDKSASKKAGKKSEAGEKSTVEKSSAKKAGKKNEEKASGKSTKQEGGKK